MSTETDLRRIVSALEGRKEGNSWRCKCPCHNGRSLIVTLKGDALLVNCKSGCAQDAVIDALKERDLWPNGSDAGAPAATKTRRASTITRTGAPQAEYPYVDGAGKVLAVKGRWPKADGGKTFRWRLASAEGWGDGLEGRKESSLPLYNGQLLAATAGPVLIVEGEKAANAAAAVGILAVCASGGAATREFGQQLEPLAGRHIILWPDNDDAGRGLMRVIAAKLEGKAASVRTIAPDGAAEAADAHDYFAAGGSVDAIMDAAAAISITPELTATATGYKVGVPMMGGTVLFHFERLEERGQHTLQAELSVWVEITGMSREPFSGRMNVVSMSSRDAFRRNLDDVLELGKGSWARLISRACSMVRAAHESADPSVDLATITPRTAPTLYMAPPLLLADGPTVIFGDGGTCKTYLALRLAVAIARGRRFLGQDVRQAPVLFVDYESNPDITKLRLQAVFAGMDLEWRDFPFTYWPAGGRAFADMVPALRRKIREAGIGYLFVDSAAQACGADPEKADSALRYFNSVDSLEIPSTTIAHVARDSSDQYPFGSVFWHNKPRLTWNTKAELQDGAPITHVGLFNRKANDAALQRPVGIRLEFDTGDAGIVTRVRFAREDLQAGVSDRANLTTRIRAELAPGARTVKELAKELDASTSMVRAMLHQMAGVWQLDEPAEDGSKKWGLRANG